MQNQITPGIKHNVYIKCFYAQLCFLPLLQNALPLAQQHYSPQETHVLIICTSWEKAFPLFLNVFLAAFLCRVGCISSLHVHTGAHQPSCLISLTTCTLSKGWHLGVYMHKATMLTTKINGCSFPW